jgi:hypothetical protein
MTIKSCSRRSSSTSFHHHTTLQTSRPPLRIRPHQRHDRNAHTLRINIRVDKTLLLRDLNTSHNTTIAVVPLHILVLVNQASSVSAQPRPARADLVIVGKRAEGDHSPGGPRRSAGFVAAAVDVAGDDAQWVDRFDWLGGLLGVWFGRLGGGSL